MRVARTITRVRVFPLSSNVNPKATLIPYGLDDSPS